MATDWEMVPLSKEAYQKYLTQISKRTFLQHPLYGDFRRSLGEEVFLFGVSYQGQIVALALIQGITTRFKRFLHIPHGPLFLPAFPEEEAEHFWRFFLEWYAHLGKTQKRDFVRCSPLLPPDSKPFFASKGFRDAAIHLVNPERTWVLDLERDLEDLLKGMRKSTRYEVRRAQKLGVEVQQGRSQKLFDIFWDLHTQTVLRQRFVPFSRTSTEKELEIFQDNAQIFVAFYRGKPLASAIILFDDLAGYYHQGASIPSKIPAAHAVLWEAIKEAKNRGCKHFNFWGVCGEEERHHPWYGLSRFKRGFGGREETYLHVQDYPLTWKYPLNRWLEAYRKWKRGY